MGDIEGGCVCGAIRFRITGDTLGMGACYCRTCQYASGGGANYWVLAAKTAFSVTRGEVKVHASTAESGTAMGRAFCADCGTPLYTVSGPLVPFYPVKVGALDDPSTFQPQMHVYMADAQPWHLTHEGLPQFPKMPPMRPPR